MTGERVEDTRTLQPGDRVRVVVDPMVGVVTSAGVGLFTIDISGDGSRHWSSLHNSTDIQVYRLPKPLPPEPPDGAEVLDHQGERWRNFGAQWSCLSSDLLIRSWSDLLTFRGPVRLLGDPIEAP